MLTRRFQVKARGFGWALCGRKPRRKKKMEKWPVVKQFNTEQVDEDLLQPVFIPQDRGKIRGEVFYQIDVLKKKVIAQQ